MAPGDVGVIVGVRVAVFDGVWVRVGVPVCGEVVLVGVRVGVGVCPVPPSIVIAGM